MPEVISLIVAIVCLFLGSILGYYARQSIARRDWKTIEAKIQKRIQKAKEEVSQILEKAKKERDEKRGELLKTEEILLRRESILDKKISDFEIEQKEFREKVEKLKRIKGDLENLKVEALKNLEKIAGMNKEKAEAELFANLEKEYQKEILEKMRKLEAEGEDRFEKRAKEILATSIQKYALSQAQEITTSTISLPNEEIKGRIIGKEGRNIRTLEKLTGVEIVVDETPETVVISGFNPIRREIAKVSLEKLIKDGRIQPVRIEEKVEEAKKRNKFKNKRSWRGSSF